MKIGVKEYWEKYFMLISLIGALVTIYLIKCSYLLRNIIDFFYNIGIINLGIVTLVLIITILFKVAEPTAKNIEKFVLKNLTTACFLVIVLLVYYLGIGKLERDFTLTAVGAITVFWYGYKTYERDKEIDIIKSYSDRYNIELKKVKEGEYKGILGVWYEEYFLYRKGYISEELWKEWDFWITNDINSFLDEDCNNESIENDDNGWSIGKFLSHSLTYLRNRDNSIGYDYGKYLCEKIDTYLETQSDNYIDNTSFYTNEYKIQLKKHFNRVRSFFKIHKIHFYN